MLHNRPDSQLQGPNEAETRDPPHVFISYSHDSDEHRARVLELAQELRRQGIDARIDRFERNPREGWPRWMQFQIEDAAFVIAVCTQKYKARFDGRGEAESGSGVNWEGYLTAQVLYENGPLKSKVIPVHFDDSRSGVPLCLGGATSYRLPDQMEALLRHIWDVPEVEPDPIGAKPEFPSAVVTGGMGKGAQAAITAAPVLSEGASPDRRSREPSVDRTPEHVVSPNAPFTAEAAVEPARPRELIDPLALGSLGISDFDSAYQHFDAFTQEAFVQFLERSLEFFDRKDRISRSLVNVLFTVVAERLVAGETLPTEILHALWRGLHGGLRKSISDSHPPAPILRPLRTHGDTYRWVAECWAWSLLVPAPPKADLLDERWAWLLPGWLTPTIAGGSGSWSFLPEWPVRDSPSLLEFFLTSAPRVVERLVSDALPFPCPTVLIPAAVRVCDQRGWRLTQAFVVEIANHRWISAAVTAAIADCSDATLDFLAKGLWTHFADVNKVGPIWSFDAWGKDCVELHQALAFRVETDAFLAALDAATLRLRRPPIRVLPRHLQLPYARRLAEETTFGIVPIEDELDGVGTEEAVEICMMVVDLKGMNGWLAARHLWVIAPEVANARLRGTWAAFALDRNPWLSGFVDEHISLIIDLLEATTPLSPGLIRCLQRLSSTEGELGERIYNVLERELA